MCCLTLDARAVLVLTDALRVRSQPAEEVGFPLRHCKTPSASKRERENVLCERSDLTTSQPRTGECERASHALVSFEYLAASLPGWRVAAAPSDSKRTREENVSRAVPAFFLIPIHAPIHTSKQPMQPKQRHLSSRRTHLQADGREADAKEVRHGVLHGHGSACW